MPAGRGAGAGGAIGLLVFLHQRGLQLGRALGQQPPHRLPKAEANNMPHRLPWWRGQTPRGEGMLHRRANLVLSVYQRAIAIKHREADFRPTHPRGVRLGGRGPELRGPEARGPDGFGPDGLRVAPAPRPAGALRTPVGPADFGPAPLAAAGREDFGAGRSPLA